MIKGYRTYLTAGLTILVGIAGIGGYYVEPELAAQISLIGLALAQIFMRLGMKNES